MKVPYRARPGAGFVVVFACICLAAGFFGWGLSTPPLEVLGRLQIELTLGQRGPLSAEEMRLLRDGLRSHPAVADNMLDGAAAGLISANARGLVDNGFAYLVRREQAAPALLEVEPAGFAAEPPLAIRVDAGRDEVRSGSATAGAPFSMLLPSAGPFPQLVEVLIGAGGGGNPRHAPAAVHLRSSR